MTTSETYFTGETSDKRKDETVAGLRYCMGTEDGGYRAAAIDALARHDYQQAGDMYTRAAWQVLAEPRVNGNPFTPTEQGWVGDGIKYFVLAGISYRVADKPTRAKRRAVEGIAVTKDLITATDQSAQKACFREFVGDCRVMGDLEGSDQAYTQAQTAYRNATIENPQSWATTPLFEASAAPIKQLARGLADGEIAISWETLHGSDPDQPGAFLAHRPQYKRQRFAELLEQAVDVGELAAPRGSTAYDTDEYQCPNCSSKAVNWVGENTLCLRCSHPTKQR